MARVQAKRQALLDGFRPILKVRRKQEQALAAVTSAAGTDPSFASALLRDPAILHADRDATAAAVTDLTAIEKQGLSAEFFLGNNPAVAPDQSADAVPVLSYTQTVTVGGTITPGDTLTTTINGTAIGYTVGAADSTAELLAASIAAAINKAAPVNRVVSAATPGSVIANAVLDPPSPPTYFSLATAVTDGNHACYPATRQPPTQCG